MGTIATHCTHTHASDPLACLPTALGRTDHPLRVRWQDQQASGGVACGDVAVAGDAECITTCHPLSGSVCPPHRRRAVSSCRHPPRMPSHPPMTPAKRCQSADSTCDHRHRANITLPLTSGTRGAAAADSDGMKPGIGRNRCFEHHPDPPFFEFLVLAS